MINIEIPFSEPKYQLYPECYKSGILHKALFHRYKRWADDHSEAQHSGRCGQCQEATSQSYRYGAYVGIKIKVYLNIVADAIPGMSLNVESRGGKTTFKWHKSMTHIRCNFSDRILNILHF